MFMSWWSLLKTTTVNNLTNRHRQENANAQMAHLVLPDTQADPSQNPKSRFCHRTYDDKTKLNLADIKNFKY